MPPVFFFTFAFGSALLVDFTSGNIAVFEQFLLWLAFAALLARRPWMFALLVVLVAQFKLTPIFFLGLLLVIDERPQWKPFVGGTALFATLVGANACSSGADTGIPRRAFRHSGSVAGATRRRSA